MHNPKDDWDKLNSGPGWHPSERPDQPKMPEGDFPSHAQLYSSDSDHAVPSLTTYTGKMGPMKPPDKQPEPLEAILADIDNNTIDTLGKAEAFNMKLMNLAEKAIDNGETPDGLNIKDVISNGEKASRSIVKIALQKRDVGILAAHNAMELDQREAFLEDRAVAVVKQTLLALDDKFKNVGFGAWMPFRYPDQWLMFCGVLSRVLAANDLIHSDNPEAYRKVLEETPSVPRDKGDLRTPQNWSTCYMNRGSRGMNELRHRMGMDYEMDPSEFKKPKPPTYQGPEQAGVGNN